MSPDPRPSSIPACTQVVSRLAVHDSHDAVIHPRDTVSVVTRTPVGQGHLIVMAHAVNCVGISNEHKLV